MKAAIDGNVELVRDHVAANPACVNARDGRNGQGWTPLVLSSYEGHLNVCRFLVAHKADVNADIGDGRTPLLCASGRSTCRGYLAICQFLVEHKADVNAKDDWYDTRPYARNLKSMCNTCFMSTFSSSPFVSSSTSLHKSSKEGHLAICQFLVEHKADVNAKNNEYDTRPYARIRKCRRNSCFVSTFSSAPFI